MSVVSRMVVGHNGRRAYLKKFGVAMLVLATAGTALALVRGSLPTNRVDPGTPGALTELGEKKSHGKHHSKKDHSNKCGKKFEKCGGSDFKGMACCQRGCACIKDSEYFSMCKAPAGLNKCDIHKAKLMAAKLRKKAAPLIKKKKKKAAIYKKKHAHAEKLQKAFLQARALAMKALQKAQAAQAELDKKNASLQLSTKKMHGIGWQKDQAVMWWETVDNEKNKDCGSWNGDCTASKCCQHGCGCIVKNPFYSQCGPPKGQTGCSVAIAKASAKKHAIRATGDKKKFTSKDAIKACDDAKAEVKEGKEAVAKLVKVHDIAHKEYAKLHAERVEAEKLRDHSKKVAELAKAHAIKAKKAIGNAADAAKSWANAVREPKEEEIRVLTNE